MAISPPIPLQPTPDVGPIQPVSWGQANTETATVRFNIDAPILFVEVRIEAESRSVIQCFTYIVT